MRRWTRRQRAARKRQKSLDPGSVRIAADPPPAVDWVRAVKVRPILAVLQRLKRPEHTPHALMEMRVEMAVPDNVAGHLMTVAGTPHRLDGVTGLRAEGDRVDAR